MAIASLSPAVAERIVRVHGQRGATWLRALPSLLAALETAWGLVEIGTPFAGARAGFVAPVRNGDGNTFVLKVLPNATWVSHEADALAHWAGRGAVALNRMDPARGALLMERAVPGDDLIALCYADDRGATAAAASVMTELRTAGDSSNLALPDLTTWIDALKPAMAAGSPSYANACSRAWALADDLLTDAKRMVIHGDLQHYNIVNAQRAPWLAVDPKGVVGPREAEAAALLRNPRHFVLSHPQPAALLSDRIDILAERLGDDSGRLLLWGYVLAVVAAAWALEDHDGEVDARGWLACADLLWHLASARKVT